MPRETQRRKTTRESVDLQTARPVQLQTSKRNLNAAAHGNDRAVREAAAVAKAFGVFAELGGNILERRADKAELAGTLAANEGRELTPEEKKNDNFLLGYQSVMDDRTNVEMQAEAFSLYESMDTTNMSQADVASQLDQLFADRFKGVDVEKDLDAASLKNILPAWEQTVAKVLTQHQNDTAEILQGEVDAAIGVAVDHELSTTGTLDLEILNKKMFGIYNKSSNDELVSAVTSQAIRLGNPELIAELQEKRHWTGGAAAPGGISKYDTVLNNALQQARAQERYLEDKAEKDADDIADARAEEIGRGIVGSVTGGTPGEAVSLITDSVARGDLDPEDARVWLNWTNSYTKSQLGGVVTDPEVYRNLTIGIADGTATVESIVDNAAGLSADDIATLTARQRAVESALRSDPKFTSRLAIVKAKYKQSAEILNSVSGAGVQQSEMVSDFVDAYIADPKMDLDAYIESMPARHPDEYFIGQESAASSNPTALIKRWKGGDANSLVQYVNARPSGTGILSFLQDQYDSGDLDAADYTAAKKELGL